MFNVCQILLSITLDTLDKVVYTLDMIATNIEQSTYGGNHGKSVYGEKEWRTTRESHRLFRSSTWIDVPQMPWTHGAGLLPGCTRQHGRV